MFITIDTFRFVPPTGFADVTGYSFRARGAKELIDVSAGVLPAGIDTLDALLAERRRGLKLGLPGSIQIDGEGATVLAGLPHGPWPSASATAGADDPRALGARARHRGVVRPALQLGAG